MLNLFGKEHPLSDWDKDNAAFHWDYSGMGIQVSTDGLVEYISEYAIDVKGYDTNEAFRLQHLYERDGSQALLDRQRKALEAVLRCYILWTFPQNVLAIYGLPITCHALEAFLTGE